MTTNGGGSSSNKSREKKYQSIEPEFVDGGEVKFTVTDDDVAFNYKDSKVKPAIKKQNKKKVKPTSISSSVASSTYMDTEDVAIERSQSERRVRIVMILIILFNVVMSGAFAWVLSTGKEGTAEKWSTNYYVVVWTLSLFYIGLTIMFSCVLFSVIKLLQEFEDGMLYDSNKVGLWSCFCFYFLLMGTRTTIFVLLRYEQDEPSKRRWLEITLYCSEVLLMSLMIFITWFNRRYDAKEEDCQGNDCIEERDVLGSRADSTRHDEYQSRLH